MGSARFLTALRWSPVTTTLSTDDAILNWFEFWAAQFKIKNIVLNKCIDATIFGTVTIKDCSIQRLDTQKWYFENGKLINTITGYVLTSDTSVEGRVIAVSSS